MASKAHISASKIPYIVPLNKFFELYGYSPDAVKGKVRTGEWVENREVIKQPDGKLAVIVEGFKQWQIKDSPLVAKRIQEGFYE